MDVSIPLISMYRKSETEQQQRIKLLINRQYCGKKYRAVADFGSIKRGDVLQVTAHTNHDCPKCIDKPFKEKCVNCQSRLKAYSSWKHANLTPDDIIRDHIQNGAAITIWNHKPTGWKQKRTNKTAIASNLIALDFDETDAQTVAQNPFIQKYCFVVYPSDSGHGCHAIFVTDFAMTSKDQYKFFYDAFLFRARHLKPDTQTKLNTRSGMLYGTNNPTLENVWVNTANIMTRDEVQSFADDMRARRQDDREWIAKHASKYAENTYIAPRKTTKASRVHKQTRDEVLAKIKDDDFRSYADYCNLTDYVTNGDIQINKGYRNATWSKVAGNMFIRGKSYAEVQDMIEQKSGLPISESKGIVESSYKWSISRDSLPKRSTPNDIQESTKSAVLNIINHADEMTAYPLKEALAIADISDRYENGGCISFIADVAKQDRKTVAKHIDQLATLGLVKTNLQIMNVNGFHKAITCYTPKLADNTNTQIRAGGRCFDIKRDIFKTIATLSERATSVLLQLLKNGGALNPQDIQTQSRRTIERAIKELVEANIIRTGRGRIWLHKCLGLAVAKDQLNTDIQCVQLCQAEITFLRGCLESWGGEGNLQKIASIRWRKLHE